MDMDLLGEFLLRCGLPAGRLAELDALRRLRDDLLRDNRQTNLTAIEGEDDYWLLHVAESLSVGLAVPELLGEALRVADVGCGAGFPLLPLAWANGRLTLVGMEPRHQRADFIRREIDALGLANCTVLPRQAREVALMPDHAGRYDAVLLRAVGTPGKMLRQVRLLLTGSSGAKVVFYKTPAGVTQERAEALREAGKFGLTLRESAAFDLPAAAGRRQFLIFERT